MYVCMNTHIYLHPHYEYAIEKGCERDMESAVRNTSNPPSPRGDRSRIPGWGKLPQSEDESVDVGDVAVENMDAGLLKNPWESRQNRNTSPTPTKPSYKPDNPEKGLVDRFMNRKAAQSGHEEDQDDGDEDVEVQL
jgi:hypothetical protein